MLIIAPGLFHVDPLALMADFQALLKARTFTPKSRDASSRHSGFALTFRVGLASMAFKSQSRHLLSSAAGWRRFSSANQCLSEAVFVSATQPRYCSRLSQADARTMPLRIISSRNAAQRKSPCSSLKSAPDTGSRTQTSISPSTIADLNLRTANS